MKKMLISALLIMLGIGMLFYPWLSNYMFEKNSNSKVVAYEKEVKNLSGDKYNQMLKLAHEYNKELAKSKVVLTDPFKATQNNTLIEYEKILNVNGDGIMAYIEIPSISVKLPIYHGTSQEILEKGAGHLGNSSLPVGGKSTHSIITGHTGLSNKRLFTDLTELKIGDLFFITVLNEKLAYKINDISVVKPEDTEKLRIEKDKDYVTLVTCTPYGVNSHRLLVRGERTKYSEQDYGSIKKHKTNRHWFDTYKKAMVISLLLFGVLILLFLIIRLIRKVLDEEKM